MTRIASLGPSETASVALALTAADREQQASGASPDEVTARAADRIARILRGRPGAASVRPALSSCSYCEC